MIKTLYFYKENFEAILYNLFSIFYITVNLFVPLYSNEIIYFNSNIIEKIGINYEISDEIKKENFLIFMDKLIEKNTDIIKKIQEDKENKEKINNYINTDNEYSDESWDD